MAEVNTKQWWISELNAILLGSNFEAIDNPTVNEDNVVVICYHRPVPGQWQCDR